MSETEITSDSAPDSSLFPIIGIGASAGGLEAFTQLLSHLPTETGMAFVLVQHLDPTHHSQLRDLLSKSTTMPVLEVTDGMRVEVNQVYVIPPNKNMRIQNTTLWLTPREPGRSVPHVIDEFLRSLAADRKSGAVGIILSGSGSDGTAGLTEIKAAGGITFVQDEHSAKQTGMPRTAINSGAADFVLPPEKIAHEIARIGHHDYVRLPAPEPVEAPPSHADEFQLILRMVRARTNVDFSDYRDSTVRRRVARRMALHRQDSFADYMHFLEKNPDEVVALYRDILINVTSFFRDPLLFEALKQHVFPTIIKGKTPETALRIWVPGCSTGQEAYSLAMALLEFLDTVSLRPPIQIFATDIIDPGTMEKARTGFYSDSVEAEISPERLRRFFSKEDGGYRIAKNIRDMCVFAKQNIAADPPFSHLDLVSCRNLLIYLSGALQQRVIPMLHYALNLPGFLILGMSETVGRFTDLFQVADRDARIYAKTATITRPPSYFAIDPHLSPASVALPTQRPPNALDLQREADRIVLGRFAPAGVLVNDQLEVLQFRGRTGPYLEPASGDADFHLLKMARENLFLALRSAIEEARQTGKPVRRTDVRLRQQDLESTGVAERAGTSRTISVEVTPIRGPVSPHAGFLILFEEMPAERPAVARPEKEPPPVALPHAADQSVRDLDDARRELAATREYLQTIIEQHAAANEELKSANEEILSSNEELQSTNEELQTAKEELQSANEELTTVNEELHGRNVELTHSNDDLMNLLSSMKIPIIIVGPDLRIRRFTPTAGKILGLIPTDVGRPMQVIRLPWDIPDLEHLVEGVIANVVMREQEVKCKPEGCCLLRIHPYRTSDNRIDGAILAFIDIAELRRTQDELRESRDFATAIVETISQPVLVLDAKLTIKRANRALFETFQTNPHKILGRCIYELGEGNWDNPRLRQMLEEIIPTQSAFSDFEITHDFPDIGRRTMLLSGRQMQQDENRLILVTFDDVTMRREAEAQRQKLAEIEAASAAKDRFLAMLSHELRTPLTPVMLAASSLKSRTDLPAAVRQELETMCRDLGMEARLIDDLLDLTRIAKGKLELNIKPLDGQLPLQQALRICKSEMEAHEIVVEVTFDALRPWIRGDAARLQQVFWNLLRNASKFTPAPGWVRIRCFNREEKSEKAPGATDSKATWLVVEIADSGMGIQTETMPQLFEAFTQGTPDGLHSYGGGLGLGLAIAKAIVERHGGKISATSEGPGTGSTFTVELPVDMSAEAAVQNDKEATDASLPDGKFPPKALRILLVEDHPETRRLMGIVLGELGHVVAPVESVNAALAMFDRTKFDLVISDLGLPDGTGWELMTQLRRRSNVKGIALSGYGMDNDRAQTRAAGFTSHLVKPIDVEQLKAAIKTAFSTS